MRHSHQIRLTSFLANKVGMNTVHFVRCQLINEVSYDKRSFVYLLIIGWVFSSNGYKDRLRNSYCYSLEKRLYLIEYEQMDMVVLFISLISHK